MRNQHVDCEKKVLDLNILKGSIQNSRLSPDTPSQKPFDSETPIDDEKLKFGSVCLNDS